MGLLRTGATRSADLNLIVQLAMGVALVVGMWLARRQQFRAHARCQSTVMLLNLVMIWLIMLPSFRSQVAPNLGKTFGDRYYAVIVAHASLGAFAELLGLYVILVAGTDWLPAGLRFRNYRLWMRTTLVVWWLVIGLGLGTYAIWYIAEKPAAVAAAAPTPLSAEVTVQNFSFGPKELTIQTGTTVSWVDALGRHSIESADGRLKSDTLVAGSRYEKRFDEPGVYDYYCSFHGNKNGEGMTGRIVVTARQGR